MRTITTLGILICGLLTLDSFGQDDQKRTNWLIKNCEESYEKITDKERVAIRFSWWRAFDGFIIIRVENIPTRVFNADSSYSKVLSRHVAIYKTFYDDLNDYKGSRPYLFDQRVTEIKQEQFDNLLDLINRLDLLSKNSKKIVTTDGSNWNIEVYKNGQYHRYDTNDPDDATKTVGIEMIKLSGLKVDKDKIY